jgi:hypothetical protein
MNALAPAPEYLVAPSERVSSELGSYLSEAGRSWKGITQSKTLQAERKLGASESAISEDGSLTDERLSELTRELGKSLEFDVAAYPDLIVHSVLVQQGRSAAWNGVKRPSRVVRGEGVPDGMLSMTGRQPAVSLRMRIFARDGTKHFESYGGFEMLQEARIQGMRFYMEIRPDLLTDRAILREGVELALWPYLPLQREAD